MAQIKDRTTFVDFWKDEIVAKSVDINGFVEYANFEAYDAAKSPGLTSPALVLFEPEFKTIDSRSDNVQRRVDFGFWIVKKATKKNDRAEQKTLQNDCHELVEQIIGRLGYLNEEKEFFGRYHAVDNNYSPIGPVLDNHFGYEFFGSFTTGSGIIHTPAKWT